MRGSSHALTRARSPWSRGIAATTLMSFLITACGGKITTPPPSGGGQIGSTSPMSDQALVQLKDAPPGLDLRVSEGKVGAPAFDTSKLPPARKLSTQEAEALLARTRPIQADPDDYKAFALRPGSQPAPRTGKTIKGQFPAPPSSLLPPAATDAGKELKVLRWMPEGAVPLAPELSVTFSQPMIAITSQDDAAKTTPVKLTPQPPGKWRWIGTKTILFDPDVRFPQSTTYTVEIPAGTKAATGNALKAAHKFTFETPPPGLTTRYPGGGPQRVDVPMLLAFDQKIDAQAVFSLIKVTADGQAVAIKMLDAAETAKDKSLTAIVDGLSKRDQQGRWIAFRATSAFPKDAQINVEVPVGTPSAEGPNKTTKSQVHSFRTYPPLKIIYEGCGYQGNCPPQTPFTVRFNNPLDTDAFERSEQVSVGPDVPGLKIVQSNNTINVFGNTKARTTYKLVVSGGVVDEFGQTLGPDAQLTWKVTDAVPTFYGPQGMVVLDPAAKSPTLDFFTTNYQQLKVRLYQVDPNNLDAYGFAMRNQWNKDKPPQWPGRKVFDQLVKTAIGKDTLVETRVDLKSALDRTGLGHAIAVVEPYPWTERYEPPRLISWVQSTKLAVDAYVDADQLIAFASDLGTGKPASGVALEIRPHGVKGTTNEQGMATLALPAGKQTKGSHYLVAKRGNDVAFVSDNNGYWNEYGSWVKQERPTQLAWYVIDDRKMYKPGEEVTLTGWLRTISYGRGGDVGGMSGAVQSINYKVSDSRGNEIGKGAMPVSAVGGFDTKFTLPKTPNLGYAYVTLEAKGRMTGSHTHGFQIQEFRRPEFSVKAEQSQGPFLIGGSGEVTVNASYFAGGPLGGAPVNWYVTASQTSFTPPNRDEYTFGTWSPWWGRINDGDDDGEYGEGYKPPKTWNLAGKTDASGAHILHLDFLSANPAVPMSVSTSGSVTDVNRQTWSASSALLVHPSSAYVGLKTKKPFVEKGQPFEVDVIGVDIDGSARPGSKIEVKAVRLDWEYKKGKYTQKEVDPQTCAVVAAKDAVPCSFGTKQGGTYKITALIVDAKGRPNQTTLTFWVTGGEQPPSRDLAQEKVQIIPDKKAYSPGNTAELLLQAPFYPAEAIVSWRRSGIVKTERIAITGPTKVITVPIADAMTPNMFVQVDLVGMSARLDDKGDPDPKLPKRPAYAVGAIDLPVPPKHRTLAVTVTPSATKLGPGEAAKIGVIVKDAQGRPVPNADATVLVVDEAVLSLTGYQFPNPINTFYGHRGADARDYYSRSYVKLAKPQGDMVADHDRDGILDQEDANGTSDTTTISKNMPRGGVTRGRLMEKEGKSNKKGEKQKTKPTDTDGFADDDGEPEPDEPGNPKDTSIAIRANFNPLAAFAPAVKTDANGGATIDIKLPDNLTRYRIVAIATAGDKQFGKGESNLTARLPLMVRPSPPRFLNFGDAFELPVIVQNQTDVPMSVKVAVRGTNAAITAGAGRELTVPANERLEVRFPAAAQLAGTARFQLVAASGTHSDASELALPVWTPATTEAFATYGVIDNGVIAQPVALPGKVVTEFGGLEVTTASTNLQALTDAMLYLVKYPYECAEQRASRVMAIAALRDVLTAFATKEMPSRTALEASVKTDLERLSQMQNYDGGFTFWERGRPSEPYLTVYVTNALLRAKAKGFTVPEGMIERAKPYLKDIERHYPWYYGKDVRFSISSYALYTRKLLGEPASDVVPKGQKLIREYGGVDKAPLEALGWMLGMMAQQKAAEVERKAIVRHAMNKVSETAGAANFTTSYGDGNYLMLASDRRVDGVMLESLIQEQKDLDLIPKIVTGLLAQRKRGRWLNTQENTFALLAMDRYFQTYEKTTPDFVARIWLGNDYAGDKAFKGRSTDYFTIPIAMKDVASHDKQNLTIQKDGAGRLYYRIGMNYAPANLKLDPADYGFVVTREYQAVDDPKQVWRTTDGTWHVKAGARVRVKLNMVNTNRRYHVALVDPMPAGFEAMNPELAVTGPIPQDPNAQKSKGAYWWWYGPWYEHQNMRDERVEAFASMLWEGVHTYEYVARATTPGNFVVPPPKAEEMYMPETFGRGGSDRLVVE